MATSKNKPDYTQSIKDMDGKPVKDEDGKTMTIKTVCIRGLNQLFREDSGETKFKKFMAATKVANGDPLTAEEVSLAKEAIGKMFGPVVVGQAWQALDPGVK